MSSKERKHSSKEHSRKHKPSNETRESLLDKPVKKSISKEDRKESSDKRRTGVDKDGEIAKEKSDPKLKQPINEKHKRERSEKNRDQAYESMFNEIKNTYKLDIDNEKEKSKHRSEKSSDYNERRKHKIENENQKNERLKNRADINENPEKSKSRADKNEEPSIKIRNEVDRDHEKRKHRSDRGDGERERKKEKLQVPKDSGARGYSAEKEVNQKDKLKIRPDGDRDHNDKRRHHKETFKEMSKEAIIPKDFDGLSNKTQVYNSNTKPDLNYDDDDFEKYDDDDFEDEEIRQSAESAEQAPSETLSSSHSSENMPVDRPPVQPAKQDKQLSKIGQIHSSFINFKIAQKKYSHDLVANKMLSRAYDLSRLLDMDRVDYDILEMAPVLEHGQYMRLFGKEGCQQEGCQTGDDSISRESQTESIEERIVWTQNPPLDDEGGVQVVADTVSQHSTWHHETIHTSVLTEADLPPASIMRVLNFIENVLEEEACFELSTKLAPSKSGGQSFSNGYNRYHWPPPQLMCCIMARFAPANSNTFVTISKLLANDKTDVNPSSTISPITVWKVSGCGGEPQMYLSFPFTDHSQSDISFVTFSPDAAASHVICGLTSGAIALWDLREYSLSKFPNRCLPPSYLTSLSNDNDDRCHQGPIISLQTVDTGTSSNSYQMISLDAFAQLFIWVVTAVSQSGQWMLASGSITDLNLRPGARYRLNVVASLSLASDIAGIPGFLVTCMTIDPTNNCQLFAGTITGQVMQHTRKGHSNTRGRSIAHLKILGETDSFESGAVTQLDYYPFFEPFLLAGYNDGLIQIFDISKSKNLLSFCFKQNNPILQLRWSRSNPAIFFSLDVEGNFCVWNVLINIYQPVHVEHLPGYIGFDLSSDSKWQMKDKNSTNNKARLILWALDGRLEVHDLSEAFSNPDLDASFRTCSLFQSLI